MALNGVYCQTLRKSNATTTTVFIRPITGVTAPVMPVIGKRYAEAVPKVIRATGKVANHEDRGKQGGPIIEKGQTVLATN